MQLRKKRKKRKKERPYPHSPRLLEGILVSLVWVHLYVYLDNVRYTEGIYILYRSGEEEIAPVLCCRVCAVLLPRLLSADGTLRSASPPRRF